MRIFNHILKLILLINSIVLISCKSELSEGKIDDLSLLNAEILIEQNPTNNTDNSIEVILFDKKGNRVSNDSISVFVNGIEEKLSQRQGLYYTDESKFMLSNVPVDKFYNVEVKLTDGKKYLLGTVQTLENEKLENIECAEIGNFNNDFVIKWNNLIEVDELSIWIGVTEVKTKTMTHKAEKVIKIKSDGSYTVPSSVFKDANSTINGIQFIFRTTREGIVNSKLLPDSKITIKKEIEKYTTFE